MGVKKKRQKSKRKTAHTLLAGKVDAPIVSLVSGIRQLLASGQFEQAKKMLEHASGRYADRKELSLCWIRYYLALNQLDDAEQKARTLLESIPYDREALLLLVEIALKKGDIATAAEAVSIGLEQYPADAEVLRCAGTIHCHAGNENDALVCFETALTHEPENLAVLADLSSLHIKNSRWRQAREQLERLCRLAPHNASAFLGLGTSCLRTGDHEAALRFLQRSLQLDPDNVKTMINLGVVYRLSKKFEEALGILLEALKKDAQNAEALAALSSLYIDTRKFPQGLEYAVQAVNHAPDNPDCFVTCAYAHMKLGHYQEAEQMYRKALSLHPQHARAGFGLASILLLKGNLEQGWKYYRARFDVQQIWLDGPWPIWNGESLDGKSLLIRTEQGMGDTIQFVRFVPWLRQLKVRKIFMSCAPTLRRLFARFDEYVTFLPLELQVDAIRADYQTVLMELPGMLGVNALDNIPADCPYLFADEQEVETWRQRITDCSKGRFAVGLVWAGNPKHTDDHNRSLSLQEFSPLFELENCCFFSLQLGNKVGQVHDFRETVVDLTAELKDFADTAAFMTALDFIISVDTAPAHLAGALNRPGAVLLPLMPDWRWLLNREDSPWYPSLRLFRQPSPGDWQSVVSALKQYLAQKSVAKEDKS